MDTSLYPSLGYGLGLRSKYMDAILAGESQVDWFEALAENYMGMPGSGQGPLLKKLLEIRKDHPIVFHCVSTNLGSTDPLDKNFLTELKKFINIVQPAWVSDHLCWNGINQTSSHELLPLPYTFETVEHVSQRIQQVQEFLGQRFMIENASSYVSYQHSEMTEWEFISEIIQRTDCGLLLDINNVYVSSQNHDFDPMEYLRNIPFSHVGQVHIAGHDKRDNGLIIDTHDAPVCDEVYELVKAFEQMSHIPSIMAEWDDQLPEFTEYQQQILTAKAMIEGEAHDQPQRTTETVL